MSLLRTLETRVRGLLSELAKFGTVGALSFVVNVVVFNTMLHLTDKPLTSNVVATVISATNAFVLNRAWSFKHRERTTVRREYTTFFVLNAVGLAITMLCLAISHYVLGFESRLADNIAANGVGMAFGTAFRFWSYRKFVWLAPAEVEEAAADGDPAARAILGDVADGTITKRSA